MLSREIVAVHSESHVNPTNTLCWQNAELLNVKIHGTFSYHWILKA
jgi:hypothetical protein